MLKRLTSVNSPPIRLNPGTESQTNEGKRIRLAQNDMKINLAVTSSFWWVGSGGFGDNPTAVNCPVQNGIRHRSKVEVRSGRVSAYLDGAKISEYQTNYGDLHFPNPNELLDVWGKRLGFSILNSEFIIHKVEVFEK